MIVELDDRGALDPAKVGAKAANLAAARRLGLPVLPGIVVEAAAGIEHMAVGAAALRSRGSGGARLVVSSRPVPGSEKLVQAAGALGPELVVRSSSPLEGDGVWAGAFTSYVGVTPEEVPKAVAGCWASAFSLDALARQEAMEMAAGSVAMAVLVQPTIEPEISGVAEIGDDGSVVVHTVAGSPTALLQGWARGETARFTAGEGWGGPAKALVSEPALEEIRSLLSSMAHRAGRCEWAWSDRLWLLQLTSRPRPRPVMAHPRSLTSIDLVPRIQELMTGFSRNRTAAGRVGVQPWEPLVAAVVLDHGRHLEGVPAAPGIGAGIRHRVDLGESPPPRAVLTASTALPKLSQLLWDAAGLVTDAGSPAAHVFETARSLGVPAVCGVDPGSEDDVIVAVDGDTGVVATLPIGTGVEATT